MRIRLDFDRDVFYDFQTIAHQANALLWIIGDEFYANELVDKGYKNVKRFQINQIAQQYADLYEEMIKQKGS